VWPRGNGKPRLGFRKVERMHKMNEKVTINGRECRRGYGQVAHTVRTRDGGQKAIKYGRKQAILLMCTECLGWEGHPKTCTSPLCPLFPFRGITMSSQRSKPNRRSIGETI
jgi:hypothetical protein